MEFLVLYDISFFVKCCVGILLHIRALRKWQEVIKKISSLLKKKRITCNKQIKFYRLSICEQPKGYYRKPAILCIKVHSFKKNLYSCQIKMIFEEVTTHPMVLI